MDQSMHFISVSTADLDAARSFYITGLDWHPLMDCLLYTSPSPTRH